MVRDVQYAIAKRLWQYCSEKAINLRVAHKAPVFFQAIPRVHLVYVKLFGAVRCVGELSVYNTIYT